MSATLTLPPRSGAPKTSPRTRRDVVAIAPVVSPSRTSLVVEKLTELILSGELKRSESLPPERELSERLGVSRTVLREAIKILHVDGLVSIRHGVGTIVNGVSSEPVRRAMMQALHGDADSVRKHYQVRCALETEIVALTAQSAAPSEIENFRALCVRMDECLALEQFPEFVTYDMEFHCALAAATRNNAFVIVLEAAMGLLTSDDLKAFSTREPCARSLSFQRTQQEHWQIMHAVEQGDAATAVGVMRKHLMSGDVFTCNSRPEVE